MNTLAKIPRTGFIATYAIAKSIVDQAVKAYQVKWSVIKKCQDHIKGERPQKPEELRKKGQAWASNDNFGKARAKTEKAVQSNVAKVLSSIALGYPTFRLYKESDKGTALDFLKDEQKRGVVAMAVGSAFSNTLLKEHRISGMLVQIEYPSYSFGYAVATHVDDDWAPDIIHPQDVAFRPKTSPDDISVMVIFKKLSAQYLWERLEECNEEEQRFILKNGEGTERPQSFASTGWSKTALQELLTRLYSGKDQTTGKRVEDWATVESRFNSDCHSVLENSEDVTIAKIYYRELDGTLSIVYIPYDNERNPDADFMQKKDKVVGVNQVNSSTVDLILFSKNYQKLAEDKINILRNNAFTETSYIEDFSGLMKYSVLDSMRYNVLANDTFNKMRFIGSPWFEQQSKIQGEKFKIGVGAGFVLTPIGFPLAANQPKFDISSHLNMMRFMEGEYQRDTQQFEASLAGRLSSRPNKDEVRENAKEVNALNESTNTIRYGDYSQLLFIMLKKLVSINVNSKSREGKGVERFKNELMKLLPGIVKTKADIKAIIDAVDSYVIDPIINDIQALTIAIQMAETPFARNRFKRMLMLAQGFPIEEVNIAVPLIIDKLSNFGDERIAIMENDMFFTTNEAIVQGTDDHIVHTNTHLSKAQRTVQAYQQGRLSPDVAYKFLENNLAHTLQHLELLKKDPALAGKADEFLPIFSDLNKQKSQIMLAAQKMMDAQMQAQQQVQLDPKTQAEIARKDAQAISKENRADRATVMRHEQRMKELELKHEREKQALEEEIKLERERENARGISNTTTNTGS